MAASDPLADGRLGCAIDPDNEKELASAICTSLSVVPAKVHRASRFNVQAFSEHLHALVGSSFLTGH